MSKTKHVGYIFALIGVIALIVFMKQRAGEIKTTSKPLNYSVIAGIMLGVIGAGLILKPQ